MENLFTKKVPLYFETEESQLILGDSFKILTKMEPETVDMIFADPPYFLSNYESLNLFNRIHPSVYVAVVMVLTCMIIVLYCISVSNERKKSREKCYYNFVYNYLTQIVEQ